MTKPDKKPKDISEQVVKFKVANNSGKVVNNNSGENNYECTDAGCCIIAGGSHRLRAYMRIMEENDK